MALKSPRPSAAKPLVAALLLGFLAVLAWRYGSELQAPGVRQATINLPDGAAFASSPARFAVSPDGRQLAMALVSAGRTQIWVRNFDGVDARPLTGTEGVTSFPVWSPDSESMAFISEGELRRVPAGGGQVLTLYDLDPNATFAWGADDTLLLAPGGAEPIRRVKAAGGGRALQISHVAPGEQHVFPAFVPGGQRFLFFVSADARRDGVWIGSFEGDEPTRVVPHAVNAAMIGRYLVHSLDRLVIAQRFDPAVNERQGVPVTLADQVRVDGASGRLAYSVSASRLVYQSDTDGALHFVSNWSALVDSQ